MGGAKRWVLAPIAVLAVIAASCGAGERPGPVEQPEAATVEVALSEFAISPSEIPAPPGERLSVIVTNEGKAQHSFAIEAAGERYETPVLDAGGSATLEIPPLEAGTYRALCTVPGHEAAGMVGALVVGEGASGAAGGEMHASMGGGMTAEEMARMHEEGVAAFPAETQGVGGQPLRPVIDGGVKVFELTAWEVGWEVAPGVTRTAFAYEGQVPGPEIRVRPGDRVRFVLHNQLPQPTTI
ncbi:MAG TPA: cupredoxin domain-containing protein, partial [Actinomycetota bacterium]|nr:cupredoxin domain-containing protein [Actinomycetota bacterium]